MKPITAIERFLADAPAQPQPQPAVTASLPDGAIGRFFVLNPIDVQHPTAQVVKADTTINVVRYGRIYKRKKHSAALGFKPPPAPAGYRFCRVCGESRPESEFYTHIKRYICRYQRLFFGLSAAGRLCRI